MRTLFKIALALLVAGLFTFVPVTSSTAAPSFEILDQQKMGTIKMTMVMVIPQPVDKETLTAMAKQLYADYNGKKYEKVFMEWYLPGMKRGAGAWAVTNFMPGLNVNILKQN